MERESLPKCDTDIDTGPGTVSPVDSTLVETLDHEQVIQTKETGQEETMDKASENKSDGESGPKDEAPYCVLSEGQKIFIMLSSSFAAIISPISSSIYYPALTSIANDMHVTITLINLTITTYLIFQGIAPSFIGTFSDIHGRRPAYLICFIIYLGANIGLALQNNYATLMVLRCLQASGSSGTIALGSAVVADVSTRAERGKYIGYATMGTTLGPSLGPIIGGLLEHFLGWRWIFWFLAIFSGVFCAIILMTFPETCRTVVGNSSVPPARWNRPLWMVLKECLKKREKKNSTDGEKTLQQRKKRPSVLAAARIATEKEGGLILIYGALLYCGFMVVLSTLTSQLASRFGFNAIQIGLCYLPFGIGSLTSRWTVGTLLDWNFRREARRHNMPIVKNQQQDIRHFNIEAARLTITIPLVYAACFCIIAYGWVMQYRTSLAGPLVMLFFIGHLLSGAFTSLSTLIVDTHRQSPATAVAANNLLRCLMGAGATALASPLIDRIGIGWTAVFIAGVWVIFSPCLWAVFVWGHKWRDVLLAKERDGENVEA